MNLSTVGNLPGGMAVYVIAHKGSNGIKYICIAPIVLIYVLERNSFSLLTHEVLMNRAKVL